MKGEKGFTLIELIVVIAIVGILSTIAIYQFAGYKRHTFCSSIEADVKDFVTAEEAYFATYHVYGAAPTVTSHGGVPNNITPGLNSAGTGTVTGNSPNCARPDGSTLFTFDQATGQYTWS